ncbi:MAG: hypothetical protein A2857_05765 [Candidatus Levybacteria bacterium RIFCSPHIGHO2_01_FULL_36_15]|nr:MAG: hypothetical protein A2857_05765 [Candidatus Levybacteria bacterium RIFCSPHIGHO2_01_FULL_36_15]OGH38403.1 MAG: hypothetical protein A2905_00565 [Candidatus Levybacteria bacterium RIFCSPLOWO2_01_FULL_36_10]
MSKKIKIILIGLFLYFLSTGLSFAVFSYVPFLAGKNAINSASEPKKITNGTLTFDESLPKTEPCPLNGVMYSEPQRQWWEKHRPLGVMIENHEEARPQSGLSSADVIYEAVAEGGITRFLSVFYCQDAGIIGPVRSARTYYLDFISEYGDDPLYAHVGGANMAGPADALGQIERYGWDGYNDLNQFSIEFPYFWRDYDRLGHPVATEHTVYSNTSKLWEFADKRRGLTNVDKKGNSWDASFVQYKFKDDIAFSKRPESQVADFTFWEDYRAYAVKWDYNKKNNVYLRTNGGAKHTDKDNGKQLQAKNLVMLFMRESNANDGYENNLHLLYADKGAGKALVLMDGKQIQGAWSKIDRTSRTIVKDLSGNEIEFNRGLIWFHVLPVGTNVSVK